MVQYDVLVVGSGSGLDIASEAQELGKKVALVEEGPMGGTCLNRGCIPSKMLIHASDVAEVIKNSPKFGIIAEIKSIDFAAIVKRVTDEVDSDSQSIEKAIGQSENLTLYKLRGEFVGPKLMRVGKEEITAEKIFIVGGTRASIPPIPGLDKTPYITSRQALRLMIQPRHLIIIGGGYIGCELAHFFSALGTKVTMISHGDKLLENEDWEISDWFTREFSKKVQVIFKGDTEQVSYANGQFQLKLKDQADLLIGDQLLVATGRKPNSDLLKVSSLGLALDEKDYIKVNEYLETNVEGVWALGDIVGVSPFKHSANYQAELVIQNVFYNKKLAADYSAIGHAVFSSPQIGGVGKTEQQLKKENVPYKVGRAELKNTGMGAALQENGLVKVLADGSGENILGCHIVGPDASTLIHEAAIAMKASGKVSAITETVFVHPALSEVLQRAFLAIG
ncbi:MAG: dihydrolipoyl dehydrogenase [Candidatus Daviesbacteria bacterium]|nr:dihydrolipoyl dehydrogenase [Candidatus Daviesbacteria bacterium]